MEATATRPRRVRAPSARGVGLGSVGGIRLRIAPGWIVVAVLLLVSLSSYFAERHPSLPASSVWLAAAVVSAAFFASILAHELSHSVVARRCGLKVDDITLFIFGGVSNLRGEPKRARDEVLIAAVGPLTSAVLGGLFLAAAALLPAGTLAATATRWLGRINLGLAVFNMLPGFPLDGGRVFRAAAWGLTGSLREATRLAAVAGATVAHALIVLGIVAAVGFGFLIDGLWLGFLGWFLLRAVESSARQVLMREVLGRIRVERAMLREVPRVPGGWSVGRLVDDLLLPTARTSYLVDEDGEMVGLITLREIRAVPRAERRARLARDVMVPLAELPAVPGTATLLRAMEAMDDAAVEAVTVLDGGALTGVMRREDLVRALSLELELGRQE